MSKNKGWSKLGSKFEFQGFHSSVSAATQSELSQSGSCGGAATLSGPTSPLPFRLHPTRGCGYRLVVKSQFAHLQNFQSSVRTSRMQTFPSSLQGIGTCRLPNCGNHTDGIFHRPCTTHHNTPTSTARVGALRPMPYCLGIRSTQVGPGRDTHGAPVLTSVRRPWVAQPRPRAHASDTRRETRSANTKCAVLPNVTVEQGW